MAHTRKRLGELLLETGRLNATQLDAALAEQKEKGCRLGTVLVARGILSEEMLAKFLSYQLDVPSVNLGEVTVPAEVASRVPGELQQKHLAVPIAMAKEGKRDVLVLAMADPTDFSALDEIGFVTGCKVNAVVATEGAIRRHLGLQSIEAAAGTGGGQPPVVQGVLDEQQPDPMPGFQRGAGYNEPGGASPTAGLGNESGMEKGRLGEQIIDLGEDMGAAQTGGTGNPLDNTESDPAEFLGTEGSVASIPDLPDPEPSAPPPPAQPVSAPPPPQPAAPAAAAPAPPPPAAAQNADSAGEAFEPSADLFMEEPPPVPGEPEAVGEATPFDPLAPPAEQPSPLAATPVDEPVEDQTEPEVEIPSPPAAAEPPAAGASMGASAGASAGAGAEATAGAAGVAPMVEPVAEISLGEPASEPFGGGTEPEPLDLDAAVAVDDPLGEPEPVALDNGAGAEAGAEEPDTLVGPNPMAPAADAANGGVEETVPGEVTTVPTEPPTFEESGNFSVPPDLGPEDEATVAEATEPPPREAPPAAPPEPASPAAVSEPPAEAAPAAVEEAVAEAIGTPASGVTDPRVLKKIKLLEAVAEVLIKKGVITQDELREHLRKKAQGDD